jgi:hypothetical protein
MPELVGDWSCPLNASTNAPDDLSLTSTGFASNVRRDYHHGGVMSALPVESLACLLPR